MNRPLCCLAALLLLNAAAPAAEQPLVLYLHGDVAADGTTPSGEAEPFHPMRLNDTGPRGMSQFAEAIQEAGFRIEEAYDAEVQLEPEFLAPVDVLILGSNQRRFSETEAEVVNAWVRQGGGLLAWSDSAFGGHHGQVGLGNEAGRLSDNDLTNQFGMFFMTDNGAGNYLVTSYEHDHFLNNHQKDGGIRFRGEGVSPVRVSSPAELLARLQEGGLGGGLRLNPVDGPLDPERDAALAVAEVGTGRVVGVFDRNLFWNAGEGTRLSHSDNREFTQRMVVWVAGLENTWPQSKTAEESGAQVSNAVPTFTLRYELVPGQRAIDLIAQISDSDADGIDPEPVWNLNENLSVGKAVFENNNPNGARIRAFVDQPGKYLFRLSLADGEYLLRRNLEVVVE